MAVGTAVAVGSGVIVAVGSGEAAETRGRLAASTIGFPQASGSAVMPTAPAAEARTFNAVRRERFSTPFPPPIRSH